MENHSERIQNYINGQMVGEELLQFQAQLTIDADLRNMLVLQKEIYEILESRILNEEVEGRCLMNRVSNNFRHETGGYLISFRKIMIVSFVMITFLLGLFYMIF